MKKTINNKKYLQIIDILVIQEYSLERIPTSLIDRLYNGGKINSDNYDSYVDIKTDEENEFYDNLYYVYDYSSISKTSTDRLIIELNKITKALENHILKYDDNTSLADMLEHFYEEKRLMFKRDSLKRYISKRKEKERVPSRTSIYKIYNQEAKKQQPKVNKLIIPLHKQIKNSVEK